MDIGCASAECFKEDHVDEADDGCLSCLCQEVGGFSDGAGCGFDCGLVEGDVFDDFGDEVASLFVASVDEVGDGGSRREDDADGSVEFVLEHGEDGGLHWA